jgi:hypothetical protein
MVGGDERDPACALIQHTIADGVVGDGVVGSLKRETGCAYGSLRPGGPLQACGSGYAWDALRSGLPGDALRALVTFGSGWTCGADESLWACGAGRACRPCRSDAGLALRGEEAPVSWALAGCVAVI